MKWKDFVALHTIEEALAPLLRDVPDNPSFRRKPESMDPVLQRDDDQEKNLNSGWTDERRAKQREAIKAWRPWENSTGPRSVAGRLRSAMNAKTHGRRSAACRRFDSLLRLHRQWLRLVRENRHRKICSANELLEILRRGVANTSLYGKKDFLLPNPAWLMVYSGLKEP